MEYITVTNKEVNRFAILKKLLDKEINGTQASKILKLSVRQVKRLKLKAKKGIKNLIHKNRGKPSNRRIPNQERKNIVNIIKEKYADFKPTFASEKLKENHNIDRDPKTIRQIMIENDLWRPRKSKKKEYHSWRQRKDCFGELEQFDGSYHNWFENRNPEITECCLLASIDDATGIPTKAKFDFNEGVFPVFAFWKEYLEQHGKPLAIYLDKFSTYKMNQKAAVENHDTQTQFQRAMKELGIEAITAHSPQAKGRIERMFETFQDRLVKELRLRNISTIPEANHFLETEFLPSYSAKYAVEPRNKTDLHKQLSVQEKQNLDSIFSKQEIRTVRNDFTLSFKNQWHQLLKDQRATVRKQDKVIVEERLDKSVRVRIRNKYLNYKIITQIPQKQNEILKKKPKKSGYIPPKDHPWRIRFQLPKYDISKSLQV